MLITNFRKKGIQRGGILVFEPVVALQVVHTAQDHGIQVLGIDGFKLTPKTIMPLQEHSVDYSGLSNEDSWKRAEHFLQERLTSSLHFEVVLDE